MNLVGDIDHLRQWVGRTETVHDDVSAQRVHEFNATIGGEPSLPRTGDPAPLAFHWCLAPRISAMADIGVDGHPKTGDFLPPVPLPRRMWAGGELELLAPLRVGDAVTRLSRIESVDSKSGRSGQLCFVTLVHEISVKGDIRIGERQDIVYREAAMPAKPVKPAAQEQITKSFEAQQLFDPSPVLLFRYSALTFNSHRIHYDIDYATRAEGYPGLVVQGPLQATLLLQHAAQIAGSPPRHFSFRGVAALTSGLNFWVRSTSMRDNRLDCWSGSAAAPIAMKALAAW